MVTAEMAVSLITGALAVVLGCWMVGLVVVQDACRVTASQVARQLARGDTRSADEARRRAPSGSTVTTTTRGQWIDVTVVTSRSLGRLGPVRLEARASSPLEPGEHR
ncbi:TadE family type IV pilus minor pilin [Acidipropionibacterium timonense]|uniref:TadE family type IV pilus minor pilin n=1 Tax=Acidipropionibacterium timonense TaxID=2161818 RepID=UPI00103124A0|nr:TadE family type IV pilus minor pilin [Acidipropionibacterium timonense]